MMFDPEVALEEMLALCRQIKKLDTQVKQPDEVQKLVALVEDLNYFMSIPHGPSLPERWKQ